MKTQHAGPERRHGRLKLAGIVLLAGSMLVSCSGIDALSKKTEAFAYRANFAQVPLIAGDGAQSRVLKMHIFDGAGSVSRQVPFRARLEL